MKLRKQEEHHEFVPCIREMLQKIYFDNFKFDFVCRQQKAKQKLINEDIRCFYQCNDLFCA